MYISFYLEDFLLEPLRSQGIFQLDITLKSEGKKEKFVLLIRIPTNIIPFFFNRSLAIAISQCGSGIGAFFAGGMIRYFLTKPNGVLDTFNFFSVLILTCSAFSFLLKEKDEKENENLEADGSENKDDAENPSFKEQFFILVKKTSIWLFYFSRLLSDFAGFIPLFFIYNLATHNDIEASSAVFLVAKYYGESFPSLF